MAERERYDVRPSYSPTSPESENYKPCQYLTVDETKRPRANSDPVGLHLVIANLPQITVTGEDELDGDSKEDREVDSLLGPPAPRPRANTCPEDMFRLRRGRPPTPPPTDIMKSPGNKKKFNFNFNTKDLNGISFIHHKLCRVSEDGGELITKSSQNIRPSLPARRASCLAALSETTQSVEEQKEEEEEEQQQQQQQQQQEKEVPVLWSNQPGKTESCAVSAKHASHDVETNSGKDFQQKKDINATKSKVRSDGVDLGMSIGSPNIVNSRYSKDNGREAGDKARLEAY